ncbi:MAG: AraC family transcriptional regulator, partial [Actinomycetota bacterium]|nr:AraC family transcriptional regulator [Actinomycetota bacterium]
SGNPLSRNTRPYSSAAAAEAAGFRPCLRCRPDREPAPGWVEAPELVCRALRALADGALDDATEDALAARLGVSARHLRRLFDLHVGATPAEVARSRRAHFARRLLDDTDLPLAQVATAAGFNSVRQFNRVMKEVFRFTPIDLRARRRAPDRLVADGGLELRMPYRAPLAWEPMLSFLAPRAIPGVEMVDLDTGIYRRVIELAGAPGVIEVSDEPERSTLLLRVHLPTFDGLVHLLASVRRLFDLDADPTVIDTALARDRMLRPLVRARRGVRVPGAIDPLEVSVRAVLGQQVSVAGATTLAGRVVERFGTPVPGIAALGLTHLFPGAATLAEADLTEVGLTGARARAVNELARAVATGDLELHRARDLEHTLAELQALPGFGPWTAHYVAMRACGERDAFPASDLGLRRILGDDPSARAEGWRPWRAYGAVQIWLGPAGRPTGGSAGRIERATS